MHAWAKKLTAASPDKKPGDYPCELALQILAAHGVAIREMQFTASASAPSMAQATITMEVFMFGPKGAQALAVLQNWAFASVKGKS